MLLSMPSDWVTRWSHLIPQGGQVLDLACGHGRHMRYLASEGFDVMGVDRNADALATLAPIGQTLCADIENDPWPLNGKSFNAIVVTNYLWRPLWPNILTALAPNGVLIYETFAAGNESVGKPSRPDFLLRHAELLDVCKSLRIVAFEEGFLNHPDRFVQRIVAVNESDASSTLIRYPLG